MLNYDRQRVMGKKEFLQHVFADALDAYIGADSKLKDTIRSIAKCKVRALSDKIAGKKYTASYIYTEGYWTRKMDPNMLMKAVAVNMSFPEYYTCSPLNVSNLMYVTIAFLADPEDILKRSVTREEKKLLKTLNSCYNVVHIYMEDPDYIDDLNRKLMNLKHGYNIAYTATWSFDAEALLSDDFFTRGVKCGITSL